MKRKIINIDQEKCNGCGVCVSGCPEGALQVIDGKARLVGDLLCDGLGACLKTCPEDAIFVEEREAEPYDEIKVLANIIPQGPGVLKAHLKHLRDHGQSELLQEAVSYLRKHGIPFDVPPEAAPSQGAMAHCPGSRTRVFSSSHDDGDESGARPSRLTHWPIQLHLIAPTAPHFRNSDLLVAADCVAFSYGDFHKDYLKNRTLIIGCPKLDSRQEVYREKLTALIDQAQVRSIQVLIMQVPCCGGLLQLVVEAASRATRRVPISCVVVGLQGEILNTMPVAVPAAEAFVS